MRVEPLPLAHAGLGAGSRMTCAVPAMPDRLRGGSQVTGPPRPASARSGQPVTGSELGVRWCSLMKIQQERRGRPRTRVQSGMLSNEYGMLACVAHVCDRN